MSEGLAYLDADQNARAERVRQGRMLYKGQHRQYYLEERRTQFDFPPISVNGTKVTPYVTYNVLRLITNTLADLLLGEAPILRTAGDSGTAAVAALAARTDLHRVLYDAAREASWASAATVEVVRWDGEVYVRNVPPGELHPLGDRQPDGQFAGYRRFATARVGDRTLLLETTYAPGEIRRGCHWLEGDRRGEAASLDQWPVKRDGKALPAVEATGIDWNTIVWVGNELDEGQVVGDYDGLTDLQDELNHKQTAIARVLAKHSDPKLALPDETPGDDRTLARNDVFFFRTKDEIPQYIVWNAELDAAIRDRDFTLQALCIAAETSQVLLGIRQGATPDAARKLRLEATKSLARTRRKAAQFVPFVRTVVETALRLEAAGKLIRVAVPEASVELRDGLPLDEADEAQTLSLLTGGKAVMSRRRAVGRQLTEPAAIEAELAELDAEAKAAMPTTLLMEPPAVANAGEPALAGEEVAGG